jgi:hypothetical protein
MKKLLHIVEQKGFSIIRIDLIKLNKNDFLFKWSYNFIYFQLLRSIILIFNKMFIE